MTEGAVLKDFLTAGAATIGAVLGIMNTWNAINQRRIRLKVTPAFIITTPNRDTFFGIEVINLSNFPVTLQEISFIHGKNPKERILIMQPFDWGQGFLPKRIEPRESFSLHFDPRHLAGRSIGKAYVRTACGFVEIGTSPALKQLKGMLSA